MSRLLLSITLAVAGCALVLSACAPGTPDPAAVPPTGESSVPLPQGAPEPGDNAGSGADANSPEASTAVPLPASWPGSVPVIPGTIVDAYSVESGVVFWGARVIPEGALADADDVARSIMEEAGFVLDAQNPNDDGSVNRLYANDEFLVAVNISTEPGEEGVLYNVQPR